MTNQRKNIFQIPTTDFSFKKIFGTEQNIIVESSSGLSSSMLGS